MLERDEALKFFEHILKRDGCTEIEKLSIELFEKFDRNKDGIISFSELTGVSVETSSRTTLLVFAHVDKMDGVFGILNKDERSQVLVWMCRVCDPYLLALVCKNFHNDIAMLQQHGIIRTRGWRDFDPNDAREGTVTCPFPFLTPNQLKTMYKDCSWMGHLDAYIEEMKNRPLSHLDWDDIYLFTDGPTNNLSFDVFLNNVKLGSHPLSEPRKDFWFQTKESIIYKEAVGQKAIEKPAQNTFWEEFFSNKRSTNRYKQETYEDYMLYLRSNKAEIVKKAEQNSEILEKGKRLGEVCHASASYSSYTIPKNTLYSKSTMRLEFLHGKKSIGSISICLGVFGWLQSEYPHYEKVNYNSMLSLAIKFGSVELPAKNCDPDYLGHRLQIIITGLRKEIR